MPRRTREIVSPDRPEPLLERHATALAWGVTLLVLLAVALIRLRLAGLPLERDEGEYAYAGQLMLRGIPPYQLAYNMKLPGAYAVYAAFLALMGENARAVRLGLLAFNTAGSILLFVVARRWFGRFVATVATSFYALLSLDLGVLGPFAHATQLQQPFLLASTWWLARPGPSTRRRDLLAGLCMGLAILFKQHAVLMTTFALGWIVVQERRGGAGARGVVVRAGAYALGTAIPLVLTVAALAAAGVLHAFWFWTIQYAAAYVSEVSIPAGLSLLADTLSHMWSQMFPVWLLAVAGLGFGLIVRPWRGRTVAVAAYVLAALLTASPGLYFRNHYFLPMLPAVALLAAMVLGMARLAIDGRRAAGVGLVLAALIGAGAWSICFRTISSVLLETPVEQLSHRIYGASPFPEAETIADSIRAHARQGDRLVVIGSEPEVYFYSGLPSATGYIYVYPLVESQPYSQVMTEQAIREIQKAQPRWVVFTNSTSSWTLFPNSNKTILYWAHEYVEAHYDAVGLAELLAENDTRYSWSAAGGLVVPPGRHYVMLYRRRDPPAAR